MAPLLDETISMVWLTQFSLTFLFSTLSFSSSSLELVSQKFQKAGTRILSNPTGKGKRAIQRVHSTPKQPLSQWTGCCLRQLFHPQETGLEFLALSHWA